MALSIFTLVLPLVVVSAAAALDPDDCPGAVGDWVPGGNRCYRYIGVPMSWKEAQKYCTSLGFAGSLAFPNNQESSDHTRRAVVNAVGQGGEMPEWLWIGLTDQGHESVWTSPDGQSVDELRFRAGQPDDDNGKEHFVHINGQTWDWNDVTGDEQYPFICQVEPVADKNLAHCPMSWTQRGNLCYKYIDSNLNWHEAQERCSILGVEGSLAFVGSVEDKNNIADSAGFDGNHGNYWIGLTDACHEDKWTSAYGKASHYSNWNVGEPNDQGGENCAHVSETDNLWNDLDCNDNERPFVCQMSSEYRQPGRCTYGWVQRGDNCYSYFLDRGTWDNALSQCNQQGGTLPFISSNDENNEVYEAAAMSAGGECTDNFRDFWIGITNQVDASGAWTSPGGTGRVTGYSAWGPGEPNNGDIFTGSEGYVEMVKGTGKWNDENGDEDAFVCQLPADQECLCPDCPIPEPCPDCEDCPECPVPDPCPDCPQCPVVEPCLDPVCPEMWTAFGGACYLYSGNRIPWVAAKEECATYGASLVSHLEPDGAEQQFLGEYIAMMSGKVMGWRRRTVAWIGLSDIEEEGTFMWEDGRAFEGIIDQIQRKRKRDCVTLNLNRGMIHDNCINKRPFVCKKMQQLLLK